jgi:glycosyltransferase involved in cell wall biosynthesis
MNTPQVSFCMTTYKRGEILLDTLKSIQRQTVPDFEVIISDNDVEGGGRSFVESLNDERFRYFVNSENLGMLKSFNKSIERSSGKYIVMISDDDPVYHDMLEILLGLKEQFPDKGMYMGGCDWFCVHPETAGMYNMKIGTNSCLLNNHELGYVKDYSAEGFLKQFFTLGFYSHYLWSTCMVKREVILSIGGVPDYGTPFLGDYAYLSALAAVNGCVMINKALGAQTLHQGNFGRNQNNELITVATNFPTFVLPKFEHLKDYEELKKITYRFLGMAMVSHVSFLHDYFKKNKMKVPEFKAAEKEVFALPHIKPYYKKYFIKKNFPAIHDGIVKIKKAITK